MPVVRGHENDRGRLGEVAEVARHLQAAHAGHLDVEQQKRAGNRMALENIRERLMLFFDAEARIRTRAANSRFRVDIEIPYKSERA